MTRLSIHFSQWSSRTYTGFIHINSIMESSRPVSQESSDHSKVSRGSRGGVASVTKIRPWSSMSKSSKASSSKISRPKTATDSILDKVTRDIQNPRLAKPQLKIKSRLQNGNPAVPDKTGQGKRARSAKTRSREDSEKENAYGVESSSADLDELLTSKRSRPKKKGELDDGTKRSRSKEKNGETTWAITELLPDLYPEGTNYEDYKIEEEGTIYSEASTESSTSDRENSAVSRQAVEDVQDAVEEEVEEDIEGLKEATRSLKKPLQNVPQWMTEERELHSDEFDTDLEDDFPPEEELPYDSTGKYVYEAKCKGRGIVPVSYLIRNLGEGNLRMRHHYLGGDGTLPLAQALKVNTVCEEIDLSDNYIEGTGAAAIAGVLKDNMFIVNLNISNNFIRSLGAETFCEALESNTTLKTLSLKGNQMSDGDAEKVGIALKSNMSLNCLDLSYNQFGEVGGIHLGAGLAVNIGLADLDLSWNCISGKGGVAICKALAKNTILEILDISWNGVSNSGAAALANSLKVNISLRVLDISNNRIGKEGAKKIGLALGKNTGLETLLMGMNPIEEEGMDAILKGINKNPALKLVGLEDISVSKPMLEKIKEMTDNRDILIMCTTGSPQQSRMNQTILAVFDRFISENSDRMEDLFNQMDKDRSGAITLEEFKYGLKDFGLRLTSKQLDSLLEELDADKSGTIELEELMAGSNIVEAEKQKMARAEMEEQLLKDSADAQAAAEAAAAEEKAQRAREFAEKIEEEEEGYLDSDDSD